MVISNLPSPSTVSASAGTPPLRVAERYISLNTYIHTMPREFLSLRLVEIGSFFSFCTHLPKYCGIGLQTTHWKSNSKWRRLSDI